MQFFNNRKGWIALWLTIVTLTMQGGARADDDIERIFIFGDSLSDPGNVHQLLINFGLDPTTEAPFSLDDIIPSAPYNYQGFQFSNGKTWAQRFARHLGTKRPGKAALVKPGKFTNYAFGGATASFAGNLRSGPEQIMRYTADFPGPADDQALYVIQFGGNDVRAALESPADAEAIVSMAVTSEFNMILELYQKGARNFLVANAPDISLSPAIKLEDAVKTQPPYNLPAGFVIGFTNTLVVNYNLGLEMVLANLEQLFPDISINRLDFFGILNDISTNPGRYGITNTVSSCINYFVTVDQICDKPNKFLFWDGIHPTRKVHRIVSKIAAALYDDGDGDEDQDEYEDEDD
jgi:outer membrane lipase/esterase